jgi:hypothetical protein
MENTGTFNYTYSAQQQEEVKSIRQKYIPREENKMELLRRLDNSAKKPGSIAAITIGVIGSLLLGVGMTCTMVWTDFFFLGIVVGVIGIAGVSLAYPIFGAMTRKQREKLAPQIMKLSNELMG